MSNTKSHTLIVIATALLTTACAATNPHEDPCYQALACREVNGVTQYRDPSATKEYGGSGTHYLGIYNAQGKRTGTIK